MSKENEPLNNNENGNDFIVRVSNCYFNDQTLVDAWKALYGLEWKKNLQDVDRIREMKSILCGGTMPCASITEWIKCIDVLRNRC